MNILSRLLLRIKRPFTKQRISYLQWQIDRLNELNKKLSADLKMVTQERDVVLGARLYEKTLDEIESFPSVDEAFSRNFKLIEAGRMVVIKAVYHFRTQVEMISDVGGCRPAELKMALNRVTDECCDFMRTYADHDAFLGVFT